MKMSAKKTKKSTKRVCDSRQNAVNMKKHPETSYLPSIWTINRLMICDMIQGHRKSIVCASGFNLISMHHVFMPSLTRNVLYSITQLFCSWFRKDKLESYSAALG